MTKTFTLPSKLTDEINTLRRDLGLGDVEATIQYLLQNAIAREKRHVVVRLYQNRQKTLRQCAEMLNVDLEEMMDILRDFNISFNDDLSQQLKTVKKLVKKSQVASSAC
jgi:predicted HTH domain antitoxin